MPLEQIDPAKARFEYSELGANLSSYIRELNTNSGISGLQDAFKEGGKLSEIMQNLDARAQVISEGESQSAAPELHEIEFLKNRLKEFSSAAFEATSNFTMTKALDEFTKRIEKHDDNISQGFFDTLISFVTQIFKEKSEELLSHAIQNLEDKYNSLLSGSEKQPSVSEKSKDSTGKDPVEKDLTNPEPSLIPKSGVSQNPESAKSATSMANAKESEKVTEKPIEQVASAPSVSNVPPAPALNTTINSNVPEAPAFDATPSASVPAAPPITIAPGVKAPDLKEAQPSINVKNSVKPSSPAPADLLSEIKGAAGTPKAPKTPYIPKKEVATAPLTGIEAALIAASKAAEGNLAAQTAGVANNPEFDDKEKAAREAEDKEWDYVAPNQDNVAKIVKSPEQNVPKHEIPEDKSQATTTINNHLKQDDKASKEKASVSPKTEDSSKISGKEERSFAEIIKARRAVINPDEKNR